MLKFLGKQFLNKFRGFLNENISSLITHLMQKNVLLEHKYKYIASEVSYKV